MGDTDILKCFPSSEQVVLNLLIHFFFLFLMLF